MVEMVNEDINLDHEKYIVAFLDILGFKSHVKSYLHPKVDSDKEILNKMKSALEEAFNTQYIPAFQKTGLIIKYKQFSDCTCFAIPDFDGHLKADSLTLCGFLHMLRSFNYSMLRFGLYLRGGLSCGFHYEDENMIFSEGLIKAYELESKSVYPRIIIDNELVKRFKELWKHQDTKETLSFYGVDKMLVSDWDGVVFMNPFSWSQSLEKMLSDKPMEIPSFFDDTKDLKTNLIETDAETHSAVLQNLENEIEKLKSDENNDNVLRKYIWLKELVKWNIDPDKSKIQFEYFLK